jgi:hypothetical protein
VLTTAAFFAPWQAFEGQKGQQLMASFQLKRYVWIAIIISNKMTGSSLVIAHWQSWLTWFCKPADTALVWQTAAYITQLCANIFDVLGPVSNLQYYWTCNTIPPSAIALRVCTIVLHYYLQRVMYKSQLEVEHIKFASNINGIINGFLETGRDRL